jgi:phosphotriesterase-related protein
VLNDVEAEQAVISSLAEFKRTGGGCIVENSTTGLHRKTSFLKRLSQETGVHVVAGTGTIR